MAITLGAVGSWAAGSITASPTLPAHAVGDMIIVHVFAKPTLTATPPIFGTPSGWTKIAEGTDGSGAAQGTDAGQTWHCAYWKIAASTSETFSTTVTNGNVNLSFGKVFVRTSDSYTWVTPVGVAAGDTTSGTDYSIAGTLTIAANDMIQVGACMAGNNGTFGATWGVAATGMTFTVTRSPTNGNTNTGNDLAAGGCHATVDSGSEASVTVTVTNTMTVAQTGSGGIIRLREVAPVDLTIQDAAHGHTADNLVLTQTHSLVVADALHAHSADNLSLTQLHELAIQDALHSHAADNIDMSIVYDLTVADALHGHVADNVALEQVQVLVIQDALHDHTAEQPSLTQVHLLVVQDAAHSHGADNLALTQVHALVVQDALHAHLADNIAIVQTHILSVQDALHGHTADNVVLQSSLLGIDLVIQDATHAHQADPLTLTQVHALAVQDALHGHLSDVLVLTVEHNLVVADALHAHEAENVVFVSNRFKILLADLTNQNKPVYVWTGTEYRLAVVKRWTGLGWEVIG